MLFDNVIEQIQASKKEKAEVVIVKLGEVTSVTPGGRAYVKLYGDGSPSTKLYTYIDGYFPEQGDKVALLPQGKTYIILGKVNDENPIKIYAKIKWVEENFCPIEYKSIIEDASNPAEDITFGNYALLPTTDNKDTLGSAAKNFKEIFIKKLTLDGESFTKIYQDRIFVVNSGTTYSLIATYAAGTITLTPSTDDAWALGTSAKKLKEIWTGLFRGAWKSGQSTERQLSWNSSNAIVPDSNNTVDLGTSSLKFAQIFIDSIVGAKSQYQSNSTNNISWNSATDILPNNTNIVNVGSPTKQLNKVYANEFYINGEKIDLSSIISDELITSYGSTEYSIKLSVENAGASSQYELIKPSVNNKFDLGNASYIFRKLYVNRFGDGSRELTFNSAHDLLPDTNKQMNLGSYSNSYKQIYGTFFCGGLRNYTSSTSYRSIEWDSSHNFYPDSTETISLGTSSKQFKNIYGKNIYVNGTAVSSDRRKKEEIAPLDWRYKEFFKNLKPVTFKYIDGTSGRKHTGFIAQEVEEAAEKAGLNDKDLAVVVKDPEGDYYLRYEEIIAVQTEVIQQLMAKVETLESEKKLAESKVNKLEARLQKIEQFIFEN